MNQKHDKDKVVQIGLNLFCTKGYHKVGLDEICNATGMTKGAFYNAFESKENFLLATLARFDQTNTDRIMRELEPIEGLKAIDQLERFYREMLKAQPRLNFMGCMVNNMMSELGAINERVAEATASGFETIIQAIEPAVKRAQKEGDIHPATDPKEIAILLHSTFYGVLTRSKSLGSSLQGLDTMQLLFTSLKGI